MDTMSDQLYNKRDTFAKSNTELVCQFSVLSIKKRQIALLVSNINSDKRSNLFVKCKIII